MFFFFFKQKTAYEMRISDWSSDVCSSDLAAGQTHLREGWHGSGHGDAPKESCSASRSASTRPDSCRARMNGGPPSTGAWCLATRSEEHTSELQSLMRISYAVFCLKKKTNTHKPNTHALLNNTIYSITN